jgi:hypothetical protein
MDTENKTQSRRKFLLWGVASAAALSAVKFILPVKEKEKQTTKMLTQDGKLVEVDIAAIYSNKKRITNKELQNWIKK